MDKVTDTTNRASRRQLLTGGAVAGLAAAAAVTVPTAAYSATVDDIPDLAPQWREAQSCGNPALAGRIRVGEPIQVAL
jgi:hypothetical protein